MKIAIVTDSSAYLTTAECQEYHITVVPIPIIMNNQIYREGVDIDNSTFYNYLRTATSLPSTSQPAPGDILKIYQNLANEGYDTVLSIHIASSISGFYQTLQALVPTITQINVVPYDSKITVRLLGYLVITAAQMAQSEADLAAILQRLDFIRARINEVFIVNDLENLVRGGRLSNLSASVGGLLKIKPLLTFDPKSNKIVAFAKIRSIKKAYQRAEAIFKEDLLNNNLPMRLLIIHANDEPAAKVWQQELATKFPQVTTEITYFGPVIGTHLGEKAIALGWMPDIYQLNDEDSLNRK